MPLLSSKIADIYILRVVAEREVEPYSPPKNLSKVLAIIFTLTLCLCFEFIMLKTLGFSIRFSHFHGKGLQTILVLTQESSIFSIFMAIFLIFPLLV